MTKIHDLPVEILDEIFSYLNYKDLAKCSKVSFEWRELINCNKLWFRQCSQLGISDKQYLQESSSLMINPFKIFKENVQDPNLRLTPVCHWKSHYGRYKMLLNNWKTRNFSLIRPDFVTVLYKDDVIISKKDMELRLHHVNDLRNPTLIRHAGAAVLESVTMYKDLVFYARGNRLVCLKVCNLALQKSVANHYEITLPQPRQNEHRNGLPTNSTLLFKITDNFLVVQSSSNSCSLNFYNHQTGQFEKTVDLHKFVGAICPLFTCLEVYRDNVFIAYSSSKHYIIVYNYASDTVTVKVETGLKTSTIVASENFFCSKLLGFQFENSCELYVWSVHTGVEVDILCAKTNGPVILTEDNRLIYSDCQTVYVRGLVNSSCDVEFKFIGDIADMSCVLWNHLVINLRSSLELWDLTTGKKVTTFFRGLIDRMWVDDKRVVVKSESHDYFGLYGYIIAFW